MNNDKLQLLMKAFIESQFSYCPLVWIFHSRALNNRINRLHERALRLVYKDNTSSFEELLDKDGSFSIHDRALQKLAIELFKAKHDLSPPFMQEIFPLSENKYDLRLNMEFKSHNVKTVYHGTDTIAFQGPKIWCRVPDDIKNSNDLLEFKRKIRNWKPEGCSCRICKVYIGGLGFIESAF